MKKLLILSIVLLSLLTLCSCGKKDADPTSGSGSTFSLKGSGS